MLVKQMKWPGQELHFPNRKALKREMTNTETGLVSKLSLQEGLFDSIFSLNSNRILLQAYASLPL